MKGKKGKRKFTPCGLVNIVIRCRGRVFNSSVEQSKKTQTTLLWTARRWTLRYYNPSKGRQLLVLTSLHGVIWIFISSAMRMSEISSWSWALESLRLPFISPLWHRSLILSYIRNCTLSHRNHTFVTVPCVFRSYRRVWDGIRYQEVFLHGWSWGKAAFYATGVS